MARWGEGDPRWIVEERPDATNVNNWHWTEKNATPWSKQRLKELLEGLKIETDQGVCKITEVKKLEGEATANNRKAKLIFFYEWDIKLKWEGTLKYDTDSYEGRMAIPNLSDENSPDDIDFIVTIKSSEDAAHKLKDLMRKHGEPLVRAQLARYIKELKEEFSQGLILPTHDRNGPAESINTTVTKKTTAEKKPAVSANDAAKSAAPTSTASVGVKIHMKTLTTKEDFKCTVAELYRAFTVVELLQAFSRSSCVSDTRPGGSFQLYNGTVQGKYVELIPDQKLVMDWRMQSWPPGHYSSVSLTFNQKEDCTELHLRQTGIPEPQFDQTESGWKRHYFEAMKQVFGFGARLF